MPSRRWNDVNLAVAPTLSKMKDFPAAWARAFTVDSLLALRRRSAFVLAPFRLKQLPTASRARALLAASRSFGGRRSETSWWHSYVYGF